MNSRLFYRGASQLDGERIIGVVTGLTTTSKNPKTGDMLQTYILREEMPPPKAVQTGADSSICGDCSLRGINGAARACYVQTKWAPLGIWKSVVDQYEPRQLLTNLVMNKYIRLGTYGDPAAIPLRRWEWLLRTAKGWTGYTHQWRSCDSAFKRLCMASVDSPAEQLEAEAAGWRTFRVRQPHEVLQPREIVCPASHEWEAAGRRKVTCQQCQLCRGTNRPAKHIAIVAHGQGARFAGAPLLPF